MSKKFNIWCDSGANAQSCRKQTIYLEDIGVSDQEWDAMSEDEKDELMKDVAFDRLDWGYSEI